MSVLSRKRAVAVAVGLAACLVAAALGVGALGLAPTERPKVKVILEVQEKAMKVGGVDVLAWTFNGTVPGPIIRIPLGTDLTIELVNSATMTHSFHTHFQNYDLSSDGTSHTLPLGITPHQADDPLGSIGPTAFVEGVLGTEVQLGVNPLGEFAPRYDHDVVPPGQTREYHFTADEVGTFVYHCHVFPVAEHISRGLFGVVEVYPPGWSWQNAEHRNQDTTGNTDAWVTDANGKLWYEDVTMLTELDPTELTGDAGVPTTGPVGKLQLLNFHMWNDPYYLGPVYDDTPMRVIVANLGEEVHSWHIHGHNFDVLDKFDPQKRVVQRLDALLVAPGQSYETTITARNAGFWFVHDHMNQNSIAGMIGWLQVNPRPS